MVRVPISIACSAREAIRCYLTWDGHHSWLTGDIEGGWSRNCPICLYLDKGVAITAKKEASAPSSAYFQNTEEEEEEWMNVCDSTNFSYHCFLSTSILWSDCNRITHTRFIYGTYGEQALTKLDKQSNARNWARRQNPDSTLATIECRLRAEGDFGSHFAAHLCVRARSFSHLFIYLVNYFFSLVSISLPLSHTHTLSIFCSY